MCMCFENECKCASRKRDKWPMIPYEKKVEFFEKYRELVAMTFQVDSTRYAYKKLPAAKQLILNAKQELGYSDNTVPSDIYYLLGRVYKRWKEKKNEKQL